MPSVYYRVDATGVGILDTVANQVVDGLLSELDLKNIFNDSVFLIHSFRSYSQFGNDRGEPEAFGDRCDIDVKFILDKSKVPWPVETPYTTKPYGVRATHKGTHAPVFVDSDADVLIEAYTSACALDMDFKLSFRTFDAAMKAFDSIKTKFAGELIQKPFDLAFSFPMGNSLLYFLGEIYKRRQAYAQKEITDYIADYQIADIGLDVRKSHLAQEEGDTQLMIRWQEINCLGRLTLDIQEPEVVREDQLPEGYVIEFKFEFQFGRPDILALHAPVSIENEPLPAELFQSIITNHHHSNDITGIYSDLMCHEWMKRNYGNHAHNGYILRSPVYDDWNLVDKIHSQSGYRPVFIAHFTLSGPVTTIPLGDLGTIRLHDIVTAILKESGRDALHYGALFKIGVYADDLPVDPENLQILDDLTLTIRSDRRDKVYHLVISEATDFQFVDPKWDDQIIRYRYFFPMTIEKNFNHFIERGIFYVDYDSALISLIWKLSRQGVLKDVLRRMVMAGEVTNEIFSYTQNSSQLADFLVLKRSDRTEYQLPQTDAYLTDTDGARLVDLDGLLLMNNTPELNEVIEYYRSKASTYGRSLYVAFIEVCLLEGYITVADIPRQYLRPNQTMYPYATSSGGYYGFNTPVRVFDYYIGSE